LSVFNIVAPVFALIAIGFAAVRGGVLSAAGHKGIAEFAFTIAIPALLFRTMVTTGLPAVSPLRLWGAYMGAVLVTWGIAIAATRLLLRRPAQDAVAIAMSATYGNVVILGIPLALGAFGAAASAPMALIIAVHSPLLWVIGIAAMAWADRNPDESVAMLVRTFVRELARNPVILSIIGGLLWRWTGLGLHPAVDRTLALLAQAGVPCALIALGASLTQFEIKGQAATLTALMVVKLAVMPLVAWVLAFEVFALPPVEAGVTVLFAAMPAGANAFLFASRYGRAVNSTSGAVALGTVLAALSASALIAALGTAPG
jgi:predicted permease